MAEDRAHPRLFVAPDPVFEAKYRGRCGLCGQQFSAGTRIRYIAKKTVAHEACAVSSAPVTPINDPVLGTEQWVVRYGPGKEINRSPGVNELVGAMGLSAFS